MKVSLRVHWLPSGFSTRNVEDFIDESKFLKVIDINREKWKGAEVQNGVFKVKVEFNVDDYERLLEWAGISIIGGYSALIQVCGAPMKCFFCKKYGHVRKDCSRTSLKCDKCQRKGHETEECNWSRATAQNQDNENQNEEEVIDDEMEIPEETNNSTGISERRTSELDAVLPKAAPLNTCTPPGAQNISQQKPEQTLEIKKESLEQAIKTIKEASEIPESAAASVFNSKTFDKIKQSTDNKVKAKIQTITEKPDKPVKPAGMSQSAWRKELKKIMTEKSKQTEHAQMNATALAASKQVKRANSSSLLDNDGAKKTQVHAEIGLD